MLPKHLPIAMLSRLLKDFAGLIEREWEPGTNPHEWIAGCGEEGRDAVVPWEYDPGDLELDPIKRLDDGEELAIRLHTPYDDGPVILIDGGEYDPAAAHPERDGNQIEESDERPGEPGDSNSDADEDDDGDDEDADEDEEDEEDEDDESLDFPSEPSFFALGVSKGKGRLRVRPVFVCWCHNPGGGCFRAEDGDFPPRFFRRIADYLGSLK